MEDFYDQLIDFLGNALSFVLQAAEEGDEPGCIRLKSPNVTLRMILDPDNEEIEIAYIGVEERRVRAGSAIVHHLAEFCSEISWGLIASDVQNEAIPFWQSVGFAPSRDRPDIWCCTL